MHELSLFGQVSHARYEQVLHILTGLAMMQPQPLYERHLVLQPLQRASTQQKSKIAARQNSAPTSLHMIHLIHRIEESAFGSTKLLDDENGSSTITVRMAETPEPETKHLVLRRLEESSITISEMQTYLDAAKYRKVAEYYIEGRRLVSRDVIVNLFRVLIPKNAANDSYDSIPALSDLDLLDKCGTFVLEAAVRIEDRTKPALLQAATEELNWFRNEMRGSVEMRVPERLSLDTRVRDP